uniref:Uncharacterized protein n=1 Tax=Cyprinus carpio TaxID=7962 RepID=A0A8C1LTG1_CYPCA
VVLNATEEFVTSSSADPKKLVTLKPSVKSQRETRVHAGETDKHNFCHTGSAAVAFMSYNTMENLLNTDEHPKTSNIQCSDIFFLFLQEFDPNGSLFCVYWNISEWIVDGCSVLKTNSSYTVCSCDHLSTFALIMQTIRPPELLNLVCVIVGLVFFSLAMLTFALCQWSPGVNNVARINICISLLLAHLLFLIIITVSHGLQVLCAVISGLLHFLFLSGFVWMFIEAVLLFICVKNLSQIRSINRAVLSSGFLNSLLNNFIHVCIFVILLYLPPNRCWIKIDKGFISSFLGPVCMILTIIITLNSTLKNLNSDVSQIKQTKIMVFKTLAQFVVLGCSWILGFFTNGSKVLEILFLILNSQQGTFIFLIYCVLNNEVRYFSVGHLNVRTCHINIRICKLKFTLTALM